MKLADTVFSAGESLRKRADSHPGLSTWVGERGNDRGGGDTQGSSCLATSELVCVHPFRILGCSGIQHDKGIDYEDDDELIWR